MFVYFFVEFAQPLAEFRVEMVLYAVVSPSWGVRYLPSSLLEMRAHLLPTWSWSWKRRSSSSGVHSRLLIFLSKWLWYLRSKNDTFLDIAYRCVRPAWTPSPSVKKWLTICSLHAPISSISERGLTPSSISSVLACTIFIFVSIII